MKKVLVLFLFCTIALQVQVKKEYKEAPLQEVLNELSESYNLIFSFSNEVVKDKIITIALNNTPIDEVLFTLKTLTNLDFKKISNRQVIVSTPKNKVEVCGYLFDEITNAPLPYASVIIESEKTGTITNDDGFFQLGDIDEKNQISIQYVGYKNKTVPATFFKNKKCPKIGLSLETTALEEVLIVEYLTTGINKNVDGSFLISNNDLGILPGQSEPDILQSVQLIPGITSPDETATGLRIRGGSSDQNLILWDDIKMYNTGHFFGMISIFNPNITDFANVYRGGADPKYGDRVSGVVDISSDQNVPKTSNGGIGINGTHADAFIKTPISKKIGLVVSGRRSYTDVIQTTTYKALSQKVFQNTKIVETQNNQPPPVEEEEEEIGEIDEEDESETDIISDDFFFYDVTAKLILDVSPNDKIMISSIFTHNDLAFIVGDDEDTITDDLEIQNEGVSFSWTGTKNNRFHHSLKAYYSHFDLDYQFAEREELFIEIQSVRRNTVRDFGVDANISYELNSKNLLTLGYQFSHNEVFYRITRESQLENPIDESERVNNDANALYANYKFTAKNKSFLNLGVRASHYSVLDDIYIEPRANIEYPISKAIRLKATAELRYQPISQLIEFENTQLRLENNLWIHSNKEEVPLLESTQFSGGFLFSKNGWNFEIDGYHRKIDGLTSATNGFNTVSNNISTGESRVIGVDVLLKKKFQNFRAWLGYTFNDIEFTFPEIQNNPFPGNNDITHNFRISNTYTLDQWELSLGWLWRSGAPFTTANLTNTNQIAFGEVNAKRLDNFHRLDISATYKFNLDATGKWKGHIGASILNVYNRRVPVSISYRLDENPVTENIELDVLRQMSLGITPNIVFRTSF